MQKKSESNTDKPVKCLFFCLTAAGFILSFLFSQLFPGVFDWINGKLQDSLFQLRYSLKGNEVISPQVIHIAFDDQTYALLPLLFNDNTQQPGNSMAQERRALTGVLSLLESVDVQSAAIDVIFSQQADPAVDAALIEICKKAGNMYFPVYCYSPGSAAEKTAPDSITRSLIEKNLWHPRVLNRGFPPGAEELLTVYTELLEASGGAGHFNLPQEIPCRRLALFYRYKDGYIPSLIFRQLCDYLRVQPENIEITFGRYVVIKKARFPMGNMKTIKIPIDYKGQVRLNFPGPWSAFTYSANAINVLNGKRAVLRDIFENSLVFISITSAKVKDYSRGIWDTLYPSTGLHLTLANMLLTGNFITEAGFFPNALVVLTLFFLLAFPALLIPAEKFFRAANILFLLYVIFIILQFIVFKQLFLILEPVLGYYLSVLFLVVYQFTLEKRQYNRITRDLDVLTEIFSHKENAHPGGPAAGTYRMFPVSGSRQLSRIYLYAQMQMIRRDFDSIGSLEDIIRHSLQLLEPVAPVLDMAGLTSDLYNDFTGKFIRSHQNVKITGAIMGAIPAINRLSTADQAAQSGREAASAVFVWKFHAAKQTAGVALVFREAADPDTRSCCSKEILAPFIMNLLPVMEQFFSMQSVKDACNHIVHEIKNTSAGINFMLSGLKKNHRLDKTASGRISLISGEMSRLYAFSTKHLDLEVLKHTLTLDRQSFFAWKIIDDVLLAYKSRLDEKFITIETHYAKNLKVTGSVCYLSILFSNILENAIKYSPQNTAIVISISRISVPGTPAVPLLKPRVSAAEKDNFILFQFSDQGNGFIEAKKMDIPETNNPDSFISSHGLGLKLCRKIVEKHNGVLEIQNKDEGGALVSVRLPV